MSDLPAEKKALFTTALVVLSTLFALVAAEAVLRVWPESRAPGPEEVRRRLERSRETALSGDGGRVSLFGLVQPSPYEEIVYELKPGIQGRFRDQPVSINGYGLRDDELELAKPAGVLRVVGLGDSHMFGWGVAQGESYLDLLEERLNASGNGRFEVINCGVPGYNTTMEVATYEHKCRAFDPDLVLLHYVGNDFELPHFMQPPREEESRPPLRLLELVQRLRGGESFGHDALDLYPHDRSHLPVEERRSTQSQYQYMKGEAGYRRAAARLAELTAADQVPVYVLMLGSKGKRRQVVRQVAAEHGFHVLNALPAFGAWFEAQELEAGKEAWRDAFLIPKDGHPNARSHRVYADFLFEELAPVLSGEAAQGVGSP